MEESICKRISYLLYRVFVITFTIVMVYFAFPIVFGIKWENDLFHFNAFLFLCNISFNIVTNIVFQDNLTDSLQSLLSQLKSSFKVKVGKD